MYPANATPHRDLSDRLSNPPPHSHLQMRPLFVPVIYLMLIKEWQHSGVEFLWLDHLQGMRRARNHDAFRMG